jgi:hypothetical protein
MDEKRHYYYYYYCNGILTGAREVVSPRSDGPMMTKTKLGYTDKCDESVKILV